MHNRFRIEILLYDRTRAVVSPQSGRDMLDRAAAPPSPNGRVGKSAASPLSLYRVPILATSQNEHKRTPPPSTRPHQPLHFCC